MTLAQAEHALSQIEMRERHVMLVVNLINHTDDRAEAARLLRVANDMMIEARQIENNARLALAGNSEACH